MVTPGGLSARALLLLLYLQSTYVLANIYIYITLFGSEEKIL